MRVCGLREALVFDSGRFAGVTVWGGAWKPVTLFRGVCMGMHAIYRYVCVRSHELGGI